MEAEIGEMRLLSKVGCDDDGMSSKRLSVVLNTEIYGGEQRKEDEMYSSRLSSIRRVAVQNKTT